MSILHEPQDLTVSLFHLLSACRRLPTGTLWQLRAELQRHDPSLCPNLSFWLKLCQTIGLVDIGSALQPTLLVPVWLEHSLKQQWQDVLNAWCNMVKDRSIRERRKRLLKSVASASFVQDIIPAQERELVGLQNLGILNGHELTPLGTIIIYKKLETANPVFREWSLKDDVLEVPPNTNIRWLWDLEQFLSPIMTGVYS
jgi:hypothetical protein